MSRLIVSATEHEIKGIAGPFPIDENLVQISDDIYCGITGVGMLATAVHLSKLIQELQPTRVIHIGIAGSFHAEEELGKLYEIESAIAGDLGADDQGTFLNLEQLTLNDARFPNNSNWMKNPSLGACGELPIANSCSVNTVSGSTQRIEQLRNLWNADIEDMESAAVFYSCLNHNIPFTVIRAISNIVAPRNRDSWNISAALSQLEKQMNSYLHAAK